MSRATLGGPTRLLAALGLLGGCTAGSITAPAQAAKGTYADFRSLHAAVVMNFCSPRGGVCHNSAQFPDLHTPENMLAVVGQRCNQLISDPTAVQDLCEPPGDILWIKSGPDAGFKSRVGYTEVIPGTTSCGPTYMRITLHEAVPHDADGVDYSFLRDTDPANPVEIHIGSVLHTKAGLHQAITSIDWGLPYAASDFLSAPYSPGSPNQIFLGDPNRNGIFGADLHGALLAPGHPEKSYFIWRILGVVKPQMPLANGNLTTAEIYALECWVYQLKPDGSNADGPIDYAACPATFGPEGQGPSASADGPDAGVISVPDLTVYPADGTGSPPDTARPADAAPAADHPPVPDSPRG